MFGNDLKTRVDIPWSHQSWYMKISCYSLWFCVCLGISMKILHSFLAMSLILPDAKALVSLCNWDWAKGLDWALDPPRGHWGLEFQNHPGRKCHPYNLCWSLYTYKSSNTLNIQYKYNIILSVWLYHDGLKACCSVHRIPTSLCC